MSKNKRLNEIAPKEEGMPGEVDLVIMASPDISPPAPGPEDPEPDEEVEIEKENPVLPPDFPEETDEGRKFGRGEYWVHYFQEADPCGEDFEIVDEEKEPEPAVKKSTARRGEANSFSEDQAGEPEKPARESRPRKRVKVAAQSEELLSAPNARYMAARLAEAAAGAAEEKPARKAKPRRRKKVAAQTEELLSAPKGNRPRGRGWIIAAASVFVVLIGGMVIIAEPWVPAAQDDYTEPQPQPYGQEVVLGVGQSLELSVPLGENEQVFMTTSSDADVLSCADDFVTAIGEWDSVTVTVVTQEKEVPQAEPKPFKIFGLDLTKTYNGLRAGLRDLLGIEKKIPPRTEPRTLSVYQLQFSIRGYSTETMTTPINLYTGDRCSMTLDIPEGMETQFECEKNLVSVSEGLLQDDIWGYIASSGQALGQGRLTVRIGFMKDDRFVITGALVYRVEVLPVPAEGEQAVFASGSYNGTVPVNPPAETG